MPVSKHFIYRGLSDSSYELLPGVFRKQVDKVDGREYTNKKSCSWVKEESLLKAFIQEASGILSIPANQRNRWAEYAQHYGVPTRFLDWTSNPLVALYFCCRDHNETSGTVYLLHWVNYRKFFSEHIQQPGNKTNDEMISELLEQKSDIEFPVLYTPYYVDARMSAQSSYFMVWGRNEAALEVQLRGEQYEMHCPDLSNPEICRGTHQAEALWFKFLIPADCKQPLLHELDTVGVNEKTLFPGLDGIGRYIERNYRFDYNETIASL